MTLLEQFAAGELINGLSLGEKALGSLYVALLGMTITFFALVILMSSLIVMSRVINRGRGAPPPTRDFPLALVPAREESGEKLVAVLAAAAWTLLGTPVRIIRVRPLQRGQEDTPAWARAGRLEQISGGKGLS